MVAILRLRLVEARDAAVQPAVGQFHRLLGIVVVGIARRTLVEGHHDVRPDGALDVHHAFGREDVLAAVDVRTELGPFLAQLADAGEGKHLETTAVGQHRAVEAVELVQAARLLQHVEARTEVQVVGVAQNDLRLDVLLQLRQVHTLDGTHGTHRHEDRRLYLPVVGRYQACAGIGLAVCIL